MVSDNAQNQVKKIRNVKDLLDIQQKVQKETALREDGYRACVTVHMGTCGIASGARDVLSAVVDEVASAGRQDIRVTTSGCIGACSHEPVMTVDVISKPPVVYGDLDADMARLIFRKHILEGTIVQDHIVVLGTQPAMGQEKDA